MRKKLTGNVVTCDEPLFVTLTGTPANRSPFRVVRSDEVNKFESGLRGKAKVERVDSLVSVTLTSDATADQVAAFEANYGITDDLFLRSEDEGAVTYTRRGDVFDGAETETIKMRQGETIVVAKRNDDGSTVKATEATKTDVTATNADNPTDDTNAAEESGTEQRTDPVGIMVAQLRFDAQLFTTDEALEWAAEKGFAPFNVAQRADIITLTQKGFEPDSEINFTSVVPAAGVLVDGCPVADTTQRSDEFEVIMLTNSNGVVPFGCWGWDANTFLEALADQEYTEKVNDGIYLLHDTLHNIMKWQWQLTPSEAKVLMQSSLDGAKWYFGNLLDALPQNAVQRSDLITEGTPMALSKDDKQEIGEMITAGVTAGIQARADADAVTATAAKEAADAEVAKQVRADAEKKKDEEHASKMAEMQTRMDELQAKIDGASNETRSDDNDTTIVDSSTVTDDDDTPNDQRNKSERSDEEIWAGSFGGLDEEADLASS